MIEQIFVEDLAISGEYLCIKHVWHALKELKEDIEVVQGGVPNGL